MKKTILVLAVISLSVAAEAKTDVKEKIQQLKTNAENSRHNLGQYAANLKVVNANLKEIDVALQALRNQRKQLKQNSSKIGQNKAALKRVEEKIKLLMQKEQKMIVKEDEQERKLREALAILENNRKQRKMNITIYTEKLNELAIEKEEWENQNNSIADLNAAIDSKEKEVLAEKKKWQGKQADYGRQVKKWKKQANTSSKLYRKYRKFD